MIVEFQRPFLVTDWLEEAAHHRVTKSVTKTFVKRKKNYSELSISFLIISVVLLLLLIIVIILILTVVIIFLEPEGSSCKFIGNRRVDGRIVFALFIHRETMSSNLVMMITIIL